MTDRQTHPPPAVPSAPWARFIHWISPARAWRAVRNDPAERTRFSAGLAAGVFIANLPLYGVQSALSLAVARWMRFHPLSVLAGSHLSTPPIGPLLVVSAIAVGHVVLHGAAPHWASFDPRVVGYLNLIRTVALEWIVGGVICGVVLAAITFTLSQLLLHRLHTPEVEGAHPAAPAPSRDS